MPYLNKESNRKEVANRSRRYKVRCRIPVTNVRTKEGNQEGELTPDTDTDTDTDLERGFEGESEGRKARNQLAN